MIEAARKLIQEDCRKSCISIDSLQVLKDQHILVTGGTGFIGKWITEMVSFINDEYSFNIQLYLLARDIRAFKEETPHLAELTFVHLIAQDVRNIYELPSEINYIIHAAGSPDNREHLSQPLRTIDTFGKGTNAVLDAATRLPNLKKIVHISSHLVYGKNKVENPITETHLGEVELNGINSVYTDSKRVAETLCAIYKSNFRLPIVIMRPFAFIGPYQKLDKPWAINNFMRDAILGGSIKILGNNETVRSYLYASDLAFWLLNALGNANAREIYNIGSDEAVSLNKLSKMISTTMNNVPIVSKSSKESYSNISYVVPNISRITSNLGVKITHDLAYSIDRTIVWNKLYNAK